ncbi:SusC/RagA family TonB-linked outer membrane protein [Alistipes sp. OttesenSCG-928-B03]|nr:SusC/RagA family TonB-linked outer membrane protein [Alistipes sp. OttesenSCG-928-B03]
MGVNYASSSALYQNARVTVSMRNASFEDVVRQLESQTTYTFVYRVNQTSHLRNLNLDYTNADIKAILDYCLKDSDLTWSVVDNTIVIRSAQQPSARVITGVVKDARGLPIIGAVVKVKGQTTATSTDHKGEYRLSASVAEGTVIEFNSLGYKPTEAVYHGSALNVTMVEDVIEIDKAVVTGMFVKKEESFTGSSTTITREELRRNYSRNIAQTLGTLDPSFHIVENINTGSDPNALPDIQLRGASTFNSISNLRGNASSSLNTPLFILDGFEITLERFMDLNQDDIESITILKDASATAMYGSRGANGVIVITSLILKEGRLRVTYNAQMRFELPSLGSYDLLNAAEKLELEYEAGLYNGYESWYETLYDQVHNKGVNTYWLDMPLRNSVGQQHGLTVTGGEGAFRFSASLNYNNTPGVMKGSLRNNFNGSVQIGYVNGEFHFNNSTSVNLVNSEDSPFGQFSDFANLNQYWAPYNEDGSPVMTFAHPMMISEISNPYYNGNLNTWKRSNNTVIMNSTSLRYSFLNAFNVEGRFSLSKSNTQRNDFRPPEHTAFINESDYTKKGSYGRTETLSNRVEGSLTVNYYKTIDKHIINAGVNGQISQRKNDRTSIAATGFMISSADHLSNALSYRKDSKPTGDESTERSIGFAGTVNYNYDMRYFADLTGRREASSSFGSQSRWSTFWSAGIGWNVTNEHYFNVPWINHLRLKYSYGVTGSLQFSPYQGMFIFTYEPEFLYNDWMGAYLTQYGNEELAWQDTYQHNLELDFRLFNDWVQGRVTYYNKLTNNAITTMDLTPSHGFESYTGNIGKTRNEGWEAGLTAYAVRTDDFQWSFTGRFVGNRNTVVELGDQMRTLIEKHEKEGGLSDRLVQTYREGHSMDALYALKSAGVNPANGRRIYLDANGKYTYEQKSDAFYYLGNKLPKVNGSLSTYFGYKGFTVTVTASLRLGGVQMNQTALSKVENVHWPHNFDRRVYEGRWRKPGDVTRYIGIANLRYTFPNSEFVMTENTFQISNINVTYDFPKEWLKKTLSMEAMSLSVFISDVFYRSSIKRERGVAYPYSINPNASLRIIF